MVVSASQFVAVVGIQCNIMVPVWQLFVDILNGKVSQQMDILLSRLEPRLSPSISQRFPEILPEISTNAPTTTVPTISILTRLKHF